MPFSLKQLVPLALLITALFSSGCQKDSFTTRTGYVVWSGEFIDGGCGWLLSFAPDLQYQPRNLPDGYKIDSLLVEVTYKDLKNRPDCLNRTDVDGQIYIHKIERPL